MSKKLLDGKYVSTKLYENLKIRYDKLKDNIGRKAGLIFIIVGDNKASSIYVRNKMKRCEEMDIYQELYSFPESITEEELISKIEELNVDDKVDGILVQLPLPKHINSLKINSKINPLKDVDGFSPNNLGNLVLNDIGHYSCTPQGILELLKYYNISVEGKDVTIIGRSNIVGKPLALMMINEGATVQVCNSKTKDLAKKCKMADILVCATGNPRFITSEYIKKGAIIIDVAINVYDGKICGDVYFDEVMENAEFEYISPVPGGVGPMTIYSVIKNTIDSFEMRNR